MKRLYDRGEAIYKLLAEQHRVSHATSVSENDHNFWNHDPADDEISETSSIASDTSTCSAIAIIQEKNRYLFNSSMFDILERNILLKVYSHQLTEDFVVQTPGKQPQPNLFVVSANQHADNGASQARAVITSASDNLEKIFFPAFSPRWCFSFNGCLTNKGATKVLYNKMDDELFSRLQHRRKQGMYLRLDAFNGITPDQIGNESLLRRITKQTAMCVTRLIY